MRIAISGARGLTGAALSRLLRQAGHDVIPFVRSKERDGIYWNVAQHTIDSDKLRDIDAHVLLAGEPIGPARWSKERKQRIYDSRVKGVKLITDAIAARSERPQAIVIASAVGYYGDTGDQAVDENAPPGDGFLADVCKDWEAASKAAENAGVRVVRLRLGHILTRGDGLLGELEKPFRLGVGGPIGKGDQYWSWITLHDLLKLICQVRSSIRPTPAAINAVTPQPRT